MIEQLIAFLAKILHWDMASTDHDTTIDLQAPVSPAEPMVAPIPVPAPSEAVASPQERLDRFCLGIRDYEGGPGDANYRNNNPGNCRYNAGGYLPKYGKVLRSPSGFAIFPSYAIGLEYLQELVKDMAAAHPAWSFIDFFEHYAPSSDKNDPRSYAIFVAKRCGVPPATLLKAFLG